VNRVEELQRRLFVVFVLMMMCLTMLMTIFISEIRHRQRIDAIFEKYEQDMNKLHKDL
jgi:uncharacterized membrane protein